MPGMGTIDGCWASSQARATWALLAPVRAATVVSRSTRAWLTARACSVNRGRLPRRSPVSNDVVVEIVPVRKEALAERAERYEADAELDQGRQDLLLGLAPPQRVLALQRGDRLDGARPADGADAGLGQPELLDLALCDEVLDGAGDVLDRHVRVDAVLVQQVDPVGPEALQGGVDDLPDVLGAAVEGAERAAAGLAAAGRKSELRRDDDLVAKGARAFPTSSSFV